MNAQIAALDLTLLPQKTNRIPAWQGRAAQALFYKTLHRIHPIVSETIHDLYKWHPIMPKPFTMSSLMGAHVEGDLLALRPSHPVSLRLTTLHPDLTRIVQAGVLPIWTHEGIRLHDQPLWIRRVQKTVTTYEDLLQGASDQELITLTFHTPTAFKQTNAGYLAVPDPAYIFGSLFNRWHGFGCASLPDALRDSIQTRVAIVDGQIKQRTLQFARGRKGTVPGFYGQVRMALHEPSAELRQMLNALASFAVFSGVGIKTTVGMGQVAA